jgi:hypothetical protein
MNLTGIAALVLLLILLSAYACETLSASMIGTKF